MAKEELGWAPDSPVPSEPWPSSGSLHLQAASPRSWPPPTSLPFPSLLLSHLCSSGLPELCPQVRMGPACTAQGAQMPERPGLVQTSSPGPGALQPSSPPTRPSFNSGQVGPSQLG